VSEGSNAPAGWYPDPTAPGTQRWWDGQQWAPPSPPTVTNPGYSNGQPPFGSRGGWAGRSSGGWAQGGGRGWGGRPIGRNHFSFLTLGVAGAYLLLGLTTHIILLGIFPIFMSVRAVRRKEPLAPLAVAGAILVVIISISILA